jgi:hypothetical protein
MCFLHTPVVWLHLSELIQSFIKILHFGSYRFRQDQLTTYTTLYKPMGRGAQTARGLYSSAGSHVKGWFENWFFSTASRLTLGPTKPPIQWVQRDLSLGVKRQESGADHAPPFSAKVTKWWRYTSTPPYVFMVKVKLSLCLTN